MELTFFDITLAENSRLRNRQASTPAVARKTVAITMGTRASTRLFCTGCWVVTVGGVSPVSVTFLVSSGRTMGTTDVDATTVVVLDAAVGNVGAAVSVAGAAVAVVFCTDGVGRTVGTLSEAPADCTGRDVGVVLPGGCLCTGGNIGGPEIGPPAPTPLIGIGGGIGGL